VNLRSLVDLLEEVGGRRLESDSRSIRSDPSLAAPVGGAAGWGWARLYSRTQLEF